MSREMALRCIDWAMEVLEDVNIPDSAKIARVMKNLIEAHEYVLKLENPKK